MKGKLYSLFLLFALAGTLSFSQSKIYLDENMHEIDSIQFLKKCDAKVFKCLSYKKDAFTIHKVLKKYFFGKLDEPEYDQLRTLLSIETNRRIDPNSTLIVVYWDTLRNFSLAKKYLKDDRHYRYKERKTRDSLNGKLKPDSFYDAHLYREFKRKRNYWFKLQQKCRKKLESQTNSRLSYVYNFASEGSTKLMDLGWIKDRGTFKNKFFNILYNYRYLIVKPTGDYFLSGGYVTNGKIKKLITKDDWSPFIKNLETSQKTNSYEGIGFFERATFNTHVKHCF